jgi:ribosomal protein L11 methyltransferase
MLVGGRADAVRGAFDVVVANLLADVLVDDAAALAPRVGAAGRLIVSGLLADQVPEVVRAYPGWRVTNVVAREGWHTLRLERDD